ncbi:hypothetical protein EH222_13470 [candidate division KSB1 bacterium]|nr:MAG: hypothetical protein EH222_13470 [candidate division KSB1 bacterium]
MPASGCATCVFRAKYDNKPRSFLGRLWLWHIRFCPGWKAYMASLSQEERTELAQKYHLKKFLA